MSDFEWNALGVVLILLTAFASGANMSKSPRWIVTGLLAVGITITTIIKFHKLMV